MIDFVEGALLFGAAILYISAIVVALRSLREAGQVDSSTLRFGSPTSGGESPEKPRVWLLLPVFNEQQRVVPALEYFAQLTDRSDSFLRVNIAVITTSREGGEIGWPGTTSAAMADAIRKINSERIHPLIREIHDPRLHGWKPHQLNWALAQLSDETPSADRATILIGVYDIDARPHCETMNVLLKAYIKAHAWPEAAQQLSLYYPADDRGVHATVWGGLAALWQSRFSLGVEAAMLRASGQKDRCRLSWCIGNGLFLRFDVLSAMGGFSEQYYTEDIELGYRLSLQYARIQPLSVFLETGSPNSLPSDVRQKSLWFRGLIDYAAYWRDATTAPIVRRLSLAMQGLLRGIKWLLTGPAIILMFGAPLIVDPLVAWICVFSALFYGWLGFGVTLWVVARGSGYRLVRESVVKPAVVGALLLLGPFYAVTYSLGPYLSIGRLLRRSLSFRPPYD